MGFTGVQSIAGSRRQEAAATGSYTPQVRLDTSPTEEGQCFLGLRVQCLQSERSNVIAQSCGALKGQLFGGSFHL